jgi:hypothetical protein
LWEHGSCCGFISVVIYTTSGWIGNLLVDPQKRGHGYGSTLLNFAMTHLETSKLERVWLTASAQGTPLYRRRNFTTVAQIVRWSGQGTGQVTNHETHSAGNGLKQLLELDRQCWTESRSPLLNLLADDSMIVTAGSHIALLQPGLEFWQIGPWLSSGQGAEDIQPFLNQAVQRTPAGKPLLVDVFQSAGLDLALRQAGFTAHGQNELMCLSQAPVTLAGVKALASLGSIG